MSRYGRTSPQHLQARRTESESDNSDYSSASALARQRIPTHAPYTANYRAPPPQHPPSNGTFASSGVTPTAKHPVGYPWGPQEIGGYPMPRQQHPPSSQQQPYRQASPQPPQRHYSNAGYAPRMGMPEPTAVSPLPRGPGRVGGGHGEKEGEEEEDEDEEARAYLRGVQGVDQHGAPTGFDPPPSILATSGLGRREGGSLGGINGPPQPPPIARSGDTWDFPTGSKPSNTRPAPLALDLDTVGGPLKKKRRCACCCCSGKQITIIVFAVIIVLVVIGFFLWPRAPQILVSSPTADADQVGFSIQSKNQLDFAANFNVPIQLTSFNWIPWTFSSVDGIIYDGNPGSGWEIGSGSLKGLNMPKGVSNFTLPLHLTYSAQNGTDATYSHLVAACSGPRPDLPVRITVHFTVPLISAFGMKPAMDGLYSWTCPTKVVAPAIPT